MRAVFVGAGSVAVAAARMLVERGHEVIVVERDRERIDALTEELDCGFVHGDGSRPAVLREVDPKHCDVLFCLSDDDRSNIIASLVGRSLGFPRVVTKIQDPELDHICIELGLEHTIVPSATIGRYLADAAEGRDHVELSVILKGEARVFSFVAHADDAVRVADLALPDGARVVCLYRDERFTLADPDTRLEEGDEVIILTHHRHLDALHERWAPRHSSEPPEGEE